MLFVECFVPEKCAAHLRSLQWLQTEMNYVIVGDAPCADDYIASIKAKTPQNVIFIGYLFGEGYQELSPNACAFAETPEAGGTHPALLEGMGLSNCVVAKNTPQNPENVGQTGLGHGGNGGGEDLREVSGKLIADPRLEEENGEKPRSG